MRATVRAQEVDLTTSTAFQEPPEFSESEIRVQNNPW